jgi:hypothetical protein
VAQVCEVAIYEIVHIALVLKHVIGMFAAAQGKKLGHGMELRVDRQFELQLLRKVAQMHGASDQVA